MPRPTDIHAIGATVHLIPVRTRMPLKFGAQVVEAVTCGRVAVEVADASGRRAVGWGETPLSVSWGWPSTADYAWREETMVRLLCRAAAEVAAFDHRGHALEIGHEFRHHVLDGLAAEAAAGGPEPVPELARLICMSAVDLALHDAFGRLHDVDIFATYGGAHLSRDLADLMGGDRAFRGRFPADFLAPRPATTMPAWHLVGGLDPLAEEDLTGHEPRDGHPVLLADWIAADGLECLKVKLRGNDADWDIDRLIRVGEIGIPRGVRHLCADFNCTVGDVAYVHEVLDAVAACSPETSARLLYVEQPFPYDLAANPIDVTSISARTRLFLDESAHDWRHVAAGRGLGWNGVALKTCKTQSGALLSLAWARAHGMDIMVQDLTNPMLAAIPHLRLAAHAGTLAGVETNAMQFYPDASRPEAAVHPGIYRRRGGRVDLGSLSGPGFGMRVDEIGRVLPAPALAVGSLAGSARGS
jgi:L-alanine-DL-glutamate epimerase-like enolase superfamily enzyme